MPCSFLQLHQQLQPAALPNSSLLRQTLLPAALVSCWQSNKLVLPSVLSALSTIYEIQVQVKIRATITGTVPCSRINYHWQEYTKYQPGVYKNNLEVGTWYILGIYWVYYTSIGVAQSIQELIRRFRTEVHGHTSRELPAFPIFMVLNFNTLK